MLGVRQRLKEQPFLKLDTRSAENPSDIPLENNFLVNLPSASQFYLSRNL